jgi:SAM-dependent methyltransferase
MLEDNSPDTSADWYREHAEEYARVAASLLQSKFVESSHPQLTGEMAMLERLKELAPGRRGLDVGCGAGARDVFLLDLAGYDMIGLDSVEENIEVTRRHHPELADRVFVADIRHPLRFPGASYDFVICDSVIQHIEPDTLLETTLPELVRVLRPGGILQLIFKRGEGVIQIHDPDYDAPRSFRLYDEHMLLALLEDLGMSLVEPISPDDLGGLLYAQDHRRIPLCIMWLRKSEPEYTAGE